MAEHQADDEQVNEAVKVDNEESEKQETGDDVDTAENTAGEDVIEEAEKTEQQENAGENSQEDTKPGNTDEPAVGEENAVVAEQQEVQEQDAEEQVEINDANKVMESTDNGQPDVNEERSPDQGVDSAPGVEQSALPEEENKKGDSEEVVPADEGGEAVEETPDENTDDKDNVQEPKEDAETKKETNEIDSTSPPNDEGDDGVPVKEESPDETKDVSPRATETETPEETRDESPRATEPDDGKLALTEENLSRLDDEDAVDNARIEEYLQDHRVHEPEGVSAPVLPKISQSNPNMVSRGGDNNKDTGQTMMVTGQQNNLYSPTMAHAPQISRSPRSRNGKSRAEDHDNRVSTHLSGKLPPSVMKVSTVVLSARKRAAISKGPSVYYEEKSHRKVATWDECMNSRPPLRIDLEGPGPWTYSPRNKPLTETNSPEWTFGMRLHERTGGGYKAWHKEWYHNPDNFTHRLRFDHKWPTPATYNINTLVGTRPQTKPATPSFTIIGKRGKFSIAKRGSDKEPAPNQYNRDKADRLVLRTAPAYTHSLRFRGTTLWSKSEVTPAPCNYNPKVSKMAYKPHHPAFTIRGIRGEKQHELGPHTTL